MATRFEISRYTHLVKATSKDLSAQWVQIFTGVDSNGYT